jgi:ABC-type lipoprotein export system ATPase subunit
MFSRWFGRGVHRRQADGRYRHGNAHLIELRDIVKTYQSAAGSFTALKQVSLTVNRGEFVAIIGKSGSGKSTLINMITGIDRPTAGEVLVGDTAVHTLDEGEMAIWRGRNLGIIFQFFQLLPTLSVIENIMLPMDFAGMYTPRERRERALHLLEQVEMADHADKLPSAVSGGQQQRVAIARALANDPPILVADEPTGNLDSKTAASVFTLFEQLVAQGKTILMVTHDSDLAKSVTRAVIVVDGAIVNQHVAHALRTLNVEELGRVTQQLEPHHVPAGATILQQGAPADRFYIITKGRIEVLLHNPGGRNMIVATMEAGQCFGEVELLGGGANIATIRAAADTDVETVWLDRNEFEQLIEASPATRSALDQLAEERAAENEAAQIDEAPHA